MAPLASVEFLTRLKYLFPGNQRSVLRNSWYLVAAVAFSACNRPEAVPEVFHYALDELKREQAAAGLTAEHEEAQIEQLTLARRTRDCLLQAGLLSGYSRVRFPYSSSHNRSSDKL